MPARKTQNTPKYRFHKATGQGYIVLNGQAIYLGRYGRPETEQRYHQLVAEWIAAGRQPRIAPEEITLREVIARFWLHAKQYYRTPDGQVSSQLHVLGSALRPLIESCKSNVKVFWEPTCVA